MSRSGMALPAPGKAISSSRLYAAFHLLRPVERIESEARGEIIPDTAEEFIPPIERAR